MWPRQITYTLACTPVATAENCWNQGESHARSRLPLRPACSRFSLSASALSALSRSLPHAQRSVDCCLRQGDMTCCMGGEWLRPMSCHSAPHLRLAFLSLLPSGPMISGRRLLSCFAVCECSVAVSPLRLAPLLLGRWRATMSGQICSV